MKRKPITKTFKNPMFKRIPGPMDVTMQKGADGSLGKVIKPWKYTSIKCKCPACGHKFRRRTRGESTALSTLKLAIPFMLGGMIEKAIPKSNLSPVAGVMAGRALQKQCDMVLDKATKKPSKRRE